MAQRIGSDVRARSWPLKEALKAFAWADILAVDLVLVSERARKILDWEPRGPSIEDELLNGSYKPVAKAG